MKTVRLTMAQALVRYLMAQKVQMDDGIAPLFHGVFAIFGHGNVAGLGEALEHVRSELPTFRAHNEQAMAHAAIAFAKAQRRRRMMICTTSVGPGATNMVTAAALAHVNRLPVLLLPGDTFASRAPDPVLQQIEDFSDPNVTANDCFKPVSRFWDRIVRPEQLLRSLPQAISVLTDPADCGPVTLALPQDVQAEAWDYPRRFFDEQVHCTKCPAPYGECLGRAVALLERSKRPLIIAGGGVHYSEARELLADFAFRHHIPVAETQAGKGALRWDHACNAGSIGVTGSTAANALAADADVVLAIGSRLQDFTTGSGRLFGNPDCRLIALNVCRFDTVKHCALALQCDAGAGLRALDERLGPPVRDAWWKRAGTLRRQWLETVDDLLADRDDALPSDAQVIGVVNRAATGKSVIVCAAGGLPGELHKFWRSGGGNVYHVEYGYSCMGYEIAGGLGVKMALPDHEVIVMVGDGSYLMLNSEIATSVMLRQKLLIVLLNNRGFGCISRLQRACGGQAYNNLFADEGSVGTPEIDFVTHARALGALAEHVEGLDRLPDALARAREAERTCVVVIDTDPLKAADVGGAWWDVPVAEVSESESVRKASRNYRSMKEKS